MLFNSSEYFKMRLIFSVIVFLVNFISCLSHLALTILPFGKDIIFEENADLNLTCKVISKDKITRYELSWKLPTKPNTLPRSSNNRDRISVDQTNDQLTVTIHNLQEDDSGIYVCKLQDQGLVFTRKISVFVNSKSNPPPVKGVFMNEKGRKNLISRRKKKCMDPLFDCGKGMCISKHYVCDGYVDCPSGYDEAFKYCGSDACQGKILCDGRCIPKKMCCDSSVDPNCTANYIMPCCRILFRPAGTFDTRSTSSSNVPGDAHSYPCPSPTNPGEAEDCHLGRYLGFGNSIMYIVASCAGLVMCVSTVVMYLACRVCSKHSEELQRWARGPHYGVHRQYLQGVAALRDSDSADNVDFLFEDIASDAYQGNSGSDTQEDNFVLVNFVPGIGFQLAECGPKPPPYTENAIGIPPPPYENVDVGEANKGGAVDVAAAVPQNGEQGH